MEIQKIKKAIEVSAPKEIVWDVLLDEKYTRVWYEEFSEGARAETDWNIGSKTVFIDNTGNGLIGKVIENVPYEVVSLEFEGIVIEGKEDYDSDYSKRIKGTRETYWLSENNGVTRLSIESDLEKQYAESMSIAWDNALDKIKEMAESEKVVKKDISHLKR